MEFETRKIKWMPLTWKGCPFYRQNKTLFTPTYLWCNDHSTSISACGVGCKGQGSGLKYLRRSFTHMHLNYARIEFLSCIKKIKNKKLFK